MPVYVIDTLKPKNGLDFPVVEAVDVAVEGYSSLADAVTHFATDTAIAALTAALDDKADKTTTDSLQAQIDQIVISASAESVVAPEVAQARVDSSGFAHATLKDRSDYTERLANNVAADLGSVATIVRNVYDNSTVETGYITPDGTTGGSSSYKFTDFIEVDSRDTLILEKGSTATAIGMRYVTAYDASKNVIANKGAENPSTYAVPAGVSFVRVSFPASNYDASNTNKLMILTNGELSDTYFTGKIGKIKSEAMPQQVLDDINELSGDVAEQESEIEIISDATVEEYVQNNDTEVLDTVSTTAGFMSIDGTIYDYSGFKYTQQFAVEEGDTISTSLLRVVTAFENGVVNSNKGANSVTSYTVPSGVTALVCTIGTAETSIIKTHHNTIYRNNLTGPVEKLTQRITNLPPENLKNIELAGYNYADDISELKEGYYAVGAVGSEISYMPNASYNTEIIPLNKPGNYEVLITSGNFRYLKLVDSSTGKITVAVESMHSYTITITEGFDGYVVVSETAERTNDLEISKDGFPAITKYNVKKSWFFEDGIDIQPIHAHLPKFVYVAVGRTVELYNNQVCLEADKLHVQWICNVGYALGRKFSITGTEDNIGEYTLTCNIYNDYKKILWSGVTTLKIVADGLTNNYTCVPIGDSLTNNKKWMPEVITLSDGHIDYIGHYAATNTDSEGTSHSYHHEGRSGYSTKRYLDGDPYTYGGGDEPEHNVFWNPTAERFDWSFYKTNVNVNPDFVQIFLGTNELNDNNAASVANFRQMVDYIRQDDANIPIYLINTIYFGTQDGIGKQRASDGYSANFKGYWKYNQDLKVMDLMTRLDAEFKNDANVIMINLAVSHDSEYNFGAVETPVNPRASQTELMPTEGVHPQAQGYYQMADVLYSAYVATLE